MVLPLADSRSRVPSVHPVELNQCHMLLKTQGATTVVQQNDLPLAPRSDTSIELLNTTKIGIEGESADTAFPVRNATLNTYLANFGSLSIPIGLLVFVILVVSKNGLEASQNEIEGWKHAASLLSTLFPILFAAVNSRLMLQAARCKLEGGATIGNLEQLLGSQTVGGAVLTLLNFKIFNALALAILLLWTLSPLGSQAMLRLVEPREAEMAKSAQVLYHDTLLCRPLPLYYPDDPMADRPDRASETLDLTQPLYSSLFMTPATVRLGDMDLWGNVKIPLLPSSVNYEPGDSNTQYSSLLGIPVLNISTGTTAFRMESTYIELDCDPMKRYELNNQSSIESRPNWDQVNNGTHVNGTFQGQDIDAHGTDTASWAVSLDRFNDYFWSINNSAPELEATTMRAFQNDQDIVAGPTKMMLQAYFHATLSDDDDKGSKEQLLGTYCNVSQVYVESEVSCTKSGANERQNCSVISQTPSEKYKLPADLSVLNWTPVWHFISESWPEASQLGIGPSGELDLVLQYIADPDLHYLKDDGKGLAVWLQEMSGRTISTRLSHVLNGFIQLNSMNRDVFSPEPQYLKRNQTADGHVIRLATVYFVPPVWTAFGFMSCLVLLASGIASVFFAHHSDGPDVLGYATTAVRNNSLVDLPKESQTMSGVELAQQIIRKRVRYVEYQSQVVVMMVLLLG